MAAQNPNPLRINLLIHQDTQAKLNISMIKWLLSTGRYFIIFVELVVILAFGARFKLDSDLNSLNTQIEEKVVRLKSLQSDERFIRQTQLQLSTIKTAKTNNPDYINFFTLLTQFTPSTIVLNSVNMDKDEAGPHANTTITGLSPSNLELSAFIKALQKDPSFKDFNLVNLSDEETLTFTITGSYLNKKI